LIKKPHKKHCIKATQEKNKIIILIKILHYEDKVSVKIKTNLTS
jgi:hypothetical protein